MKSSLVKILFFIILNILLYFTLTFDVNFLYITINLLIIFILYEFDIYKKKIDGKLDKFQKMTDNKDFDVNYLPASEHPIIKAAKKRLKN